MSLPVGVARVARASSRDVRGRTANLSAGGLAVELPTRLRPGTRVTFEVQTAIGPLRMEADVLWTQRAPGGDDRTRHGLCLADHSEVVDLPLQALLGQWLQDQASRKRAKPAGPRSGRSRRSQPSRQ